MLPCSGVSRIKLKRDSFNRNSKLKPNKRRWTGLKTVSGLNQLADRGLQVQDKASSPGLETADVVYSELNTNEICEPASGFDGQASSKRDARAEHDGCGGGYNQGTFPPTVSGFNDCPWGGTKAQSTCTRNQPPCKKTPKRLSEHRKEFFYRLRLALCLKRQNGGKRVMHGQTEVQCHALSYINSNVSVESDNISIKSTVCGESVEQTPPAQLDPKYDQNTVGPDNLGQGKPRAGRGRPRKLFIDHFGGPDGRMKTTIKTDARRARASKARRAFSGKTPSDPLSGAVASTYVSDTAETPDGSAKEWDTCLKRNLDCESMRQTDVEGTDLVLPGCDDSGPVLHFCDKDKACPMKNISESPTSPARRVPPLILRRVAVNGFGFRGGGDDDGENSGHSLDEEKEEDSSNENSDSEVNSPESFSCQRVQAYIFFPQSSCARTYKTWPFPRMGPPNDPRSHLRTGPRWIVTTSFPAIIQTPLSGAPECLSDKDIQYEMYKPTKQSKISYDTRELLEGQPVCSFVPGENTLESTQKGRVQSLNPSHTMTQDSFILRLADHNSCSSESRDMLEQHPSASGEKPHNCTPERTPRSLVHSPNVLLTHVSKPAEPESNQSLKKALKDVLESSVPVVTEQVNICKFNGLDYATSLEECSLLKNQCLLKKSNQKMLSSVPEIQADFISDLEISACPVSQTSRAQTVEDQEWNENCDGQTLYNPGSLSVICLQVEMLKEQHPPLVTTTSIMDQDADATPHTAGSNPDCSGDEKQKQEFDSCTVADSSSEDENEHVPSLSSDDFVEHDAAVSSQSDGDGTGQMNNEEQGCSPPQFPVDADSFLDASRAYEEDVLVLDVIQDDPELFGAVVTETLIEQDTSAEENGETPPKTEKLQTGNHCKIVWDQNADGSSESCPTAADVKTDSMTDGGSLTVKETDNYRAQPVQEMSISNSENATDCNNNKEMSQTNGISVINTRASRLAMDPCSNGYEVTPKETSTLRTFNSNYCWFYFSEYNSCMRSVCWFMHVPRDGDEKFCMDTVKKFCHTGKHGLILRAVEVFMAYYSSCSPSVSFSEEIVNSLLSSLLNFCLLREFDAVINLLLKHKRRPPPEMMLAAFKLVMERGLINSVPELIHLTSRIVEAGCVFSVDQCEVMQNHLQMMQVPRHQMDIFLAVKCRALVTNPHTSELSDLAQAVVRVEMLKHQEDWAGLALVFCNVCVGSHSQMELLRFCCCVTMALLKEPKGKLTLPYELFAESVCQQVLSNDMIKTILGRIGVSLIFRYHRTRDWNKGVKLVSVMFRLHIEFITLKGLMGNENRVSRCQLVTMATEFFLHSGSIEGALKMLRADGWFVNSSMWPCEQVDIENRKHVLTLLAEKTSHRDAFEIITNLPGIRQPINGVQINEYAETFNVHLRLCLVKQTLPVAADILEFMLIHGVVPDTLQLQNLIHKLGKQNNWSRARALFKRAQSAGFYSAVVCERDSLFLPCNLSEIEMTLAFEMFITFINTKLLAPSGASQPLLITLRRHADIEDLTESVYLAAGCRLLSAALIPNPKLSIRYTAVNKSQEQFFHLDRASAHKWFLQNERWAREIWAS
ncbi:protein TOPAZ1 isoform X3 [Carassius carassius]|uniref:protein TOPAZ1 isoform X3 n=1 Tax=Carassius carassius TaxID=217509 RepID=UPI002868E788|nr:protein TOPAZ1 isoform X3 [Carassius carassius]